MTTEQMDWLDDQKAKKQAKPEGDPWDFVGTCDWGSCNRPVYYWRWAPELETWLPVCERHSEEWRPWYSRFRRARRGEKAAKKALT